MNRKQFLKTCLKSGVCGCGAALSFGRGFPSKPGKSILQNSTQGQESWIPELEKRMIKGAATPAWRKAEKAEQWIKALMDHMDTILSQETKIKLMQACGRSCYIQAFGIADERKPSPEGRKNYLDLLKKAGYEVRQEGSIHTIIINWGRKHQNPQGLIMQDGYCMCPLVESGPPDLSPTYCFCSTGYIKENLERRLGAPLKVELLESLKTGGKDCVFKVTAENKI